MAAFTDVEMPVFEAGMAEAEEEMQYRIKDAARGVGGEIAGRFNGNHDQPENGGDPGLQDMVAVGAQAGGELAFLTITFEDWAAEGKALRG